MSFVDIFAKLFCSKLSTRLERELEKSLNTKLDLHTRIEELEAQLSYNNAAIAICEARIIRLKNGIDAITK